MPKYVRQIQHSRRTLPGGSGGVETLKRTVMEQNAAYCLIYEGLRGHRAIISASDTGVRIDRPVR